MVVSLDLELLHNFFDGFLDVYWRVVYCVGLAKSPPKIKVNLPRPAFSGTFKDNIKIIHKNQRWSHPHGFLSP
jgi:hypothetical protein